MKVPPYMRKTNFHETDQMGIIHHSNYIRWFEEARVDFMDKVGYGYDRAVEAGIDFAVLGVACDYRKMIRFNETVAIHCSITEMTASRMTVSYRVENAAGELCATGETRHCYYHNARGKPISLKKELPELFGLFVSLRVAE